MRTMPLYALLPPKELLAALRYFTPNEPATEKLLIRRFAVVLRQAYSVSELSRSMTYIAERIRLGDRLIQARHIEQSVRELRSDFTAKELRAFAANLDAGLGRPHYALEAFYEASDDGKPNLELSEVFRTHVRFMRRCAERAKGPWSRWTIRLVE